MNGAWGGFIPLIFVCILLIFRFISSVVEEYLATSIAYISEWLKLSEAMGAVTLLAFANGAGDVVTAIVASTSPTGISYNIGSLYGAGLFITTLVVGVTIFKAGLDEVQLEASSIWRDVGFNIIATIMIIVFGIIGSLDFFHAILFLGLYVSLVISVFVQEKFFPSEDQDEDFSEDSPTPRSQEYNIQQDDLDSDSNQVITSQQKLGGIREQVEVSIIKMKKNNLCVVRVQMLKESRERDNTLSQINLISKIFFIIDLPFKYAMKLTMPPTENEKYSKVWCCLCIAPGIIIITWILSRTFYWYYLYGLLPLGLSISVAIWFTSPPDNVYNKQYVVKFQIVTSSILYFALDICYIWINNLDVLSFWNID